MQIIKKLEVVSILNIVNVSFKKNSIACCQSARLLFCSQATDVIYFSINKIITPSKNNTHKNHRSHIGFIEHIQFGLYFFL